MKNFKIVFFLFILLFSFQQVAFAQRDIDRDGIKNGKRGDVYGGKDRCPYEAEDFDNFQDSDGCPDYDNDQDGILDVVDKCPNKPEDYDGFQDTDGCPDLDNNDIKKDDKFNFPYHGDALMGLLWLNESSKEVNELVNDYGFVRNDFGGYNSKSAKNIHFGTRDGIVSYIIIKWLGSDPKHQQYMLPFGIKGEMSIYETERHLVSSDKFTKFEFKDNGDYFLIFHTVYQGRKVRISLQKSKNISYLQVKFLLVKDDFDMDKFAEEHNKELKQARLAQLDELIKRDKEEKRLQKERELRAAELAKLNHQLEQERMEEEKRTESEAGIGIKFKKVNYKAVVSSVVKNGPAHRAGISPEDIILSVDGKNPHLLPLSYYTGPLGSKISIGLKKLGTEDNSMVYITIERELMDSINDQEEITQRTDPSIGATFKMIGDMIVVHSVVMNGPAHKAGITPFDIIETVDGKKTFLGSGFAFGPKGSSVTIGFRKRSNTTCGLITNITIQRKIMDNNSINLVNDFQGNTVTEQQIVECKKLWDGRLLVNLIGKNWNTDPTAKKMRDDCGYVKIKYDHQGPYLSYDLSWDIWYNSDRATRLGVLNGTIVELKISPFIPIPGKLFGDLLQHQIEADGGYDIKTTDYNVSFRYKAEKTQILVQGDNIYGACMYYYSANANDPINAVVKEELLARAVERERRQIEAIAEGERKQKNYEAEEAQKTYDQHQKILGSGQIAYSAGSWCNGDCMNGYGTTSIASGPFHGSSYEGSWKNGLAAGRGKLTIPYLGYTYVGFFIDGRISSGKFTDKGGTRYEGNFDGDNWCFNGKGIYWALDGVACEGDFKGGQFDGWITMRGSDRNQKTSLLYDNGYAVKGALYANFTNGRKIADLDRNTLDGFASVLEGCLRFK